MLRIFKKPCFTPLCFFTVLLGLFLFVCSAAYPSVSSRTSVSSRSSSSNFWIALDFKVDSGEHITAPVGKGLDLSPKFNWKNAKILHTIWPEHKDLPISGLYKGYSEDFTVLFYVATIDNNQPIECDVFYASCGNSCRPVDEHLVINKDGLLTDIPQQASAPSDHTSSLALMLLMALIGGIILNCMPCVFPIISIKIFSLIKNHSISRKAKALQGVFFTIGAMATFASIGTVLFIFKRAGENVGWGFYMQNPIFVLILLIVFIMCALYFFGLYTFPAINFKNKDRGLYIQSFCNGVFTSIASGMCVGPFIGVALSSALVYDNYIASMAVFQVLGLGVGFPFLMVCLIPGIHKILPKPGQWMLNMKEFMGFAMLISCIWLIYTLSSQIQIIKLIAVLAGCICLSLFIWMFGKSINSKIMKIFSIIGMSSCLYFMVDQINPQHIYQKESIAWEPFSFARFEELKKEDRGIFINFTASWCLTCNVNKMVLESDEVRNAFKKHNIAPLIADWSNRNDEITNALSMFGYNSIPLYVYYSPVSHRTIILHSLLRSRDIMNVINEGNAKEAK